MQNNYIEKIWNSSPLFIRNLINKYSFGSARRIKFYYKLASFTSSGGKISDILELLLDSAKRNKLPQLYIIKKTLMRINDGMSFHVAISPFIPQSDRVVLVAGKDANDMSDVFMRLADTLKSMNSMISTAMRTVIAQVIYLVLVLGVLSFLTLTISELMNDMLSYSNSTGSKPIIFTSSTNLYVSVGSFLREYYYYVAIGIVVFIILVIVSLPKWSGKLREYFHRWVFPFTVYRSFEVTRFFLALGSLLGSGVVVSKAFLLLKKNSTNYAAYYIDVMQEKYQRTNQAQQSFQSNFYNADTNDELFFYMKNSKDLSEAIDFMIQEQLIQVDIAIQRANKFFASFIFLFVVVMVFWSGASIYELMDVMKKSAG